MTQVNHMYTYLLYMKTGGENFVVPNVLSICVRAEKCAFGLKVVQTSAATIRFEWTKYHAPSLKSRTEYPRCTHFFDILRFFQNIPTCVVAMVPAPHPDLVP